MLSTRKIKALTLFPFAATIFCTVQTALAQTAGDNVQAIPAGSTSAAGANPAAQAKVPLSGGTQATLEPDPVKSCQAYLSTEEPQKTRKKRGPVRMVAKALASELGTDSSDLLKDTAFVFSAKDFDPYDQKAPTNKPYTALEFQYIDGSQASLIRYPDNSGKIVGGFADGTIIAPTGKDTFIVAYPNGLRGKMVKVSSQEYKIYRPDDSVTTIKKEMSGEYQISNSKSGYMGTAQPDRLGMQYEFHTKNF